MSGKILVAGALGLVGRAVLDHFEGLGDWDMVGLSRRAWDLPTRAQSVAVDLSDRDATLTALGQVRDLTHIVYAAVAETPILAAGWTEPAQVATNEAMLQNLLDAVELNNPNLRHVTLLQGGKAYGAHLGPIKLPAKESDPRHMPPNFYFAQEDLLRVRQSEGRGWSWTVLRPMSLVGFALRSPMNVLSTVCAYAAISRKLGVPFRFTGAEHSQIGELTDTRILARAIAWAGREREAQNQIFNVTNGDVIVWQEIWPRLAAALHVDWALPQPMPLSVMMRDKAPVWDAIVREHGLVPNAYGDIVGNSWQFADALFGHGASKPIVAMMSTVKIRKAGFHDVIDSDEMFQEWIQRLQAGRIFPR